MDVDKLAIDLLLKGMTQEQQTAALESIKDSVTQAKAVQKQRIGENVQVVVQALKKIESDIKARYDETGKAIEKRVASIKDGQDGRNGTDGKAGKDGRPGRDGAVGPKGADGLNGRDGTDGENGVSVTDAHIDFDGSLVISLSSGRVINVGEVVAPDLAEKIKVITNGGGTSQTVIDALASLQTQINNLIPSQTGNAGKFLTTDGTNTSWDSIAAGGLSYQGTWNASTNTPTLTSSTGTTGYYYITATAGSTNLDGITDWQIGDWLLFNGTVWQKIDQSNLVTSVNGQTGAVSLSTTNISEGTNLYYTDTRARAAVSAGTGISYSSATGVITNAAPDQTVALTQGGTTTITGTYPNFTISSDDQYDGTVTSVGGTGTVNGISLSGTVTSSGSLTLSGTLDLSSPPTIGNAAPNTGAFTTLSTTGALTYGGVTLSNSVTGTGSMVLSSSPTLVTPALGTPSSGTLTNCTFPTLNQNTTGTASNVTGTVAVANGGTGLTTLTTNNVILGNGTSAVAFVAPGTSGNLLTSDGTTWTSVAAASSAGVPAGSVIWHAANAAPTGFLKANGATVSRSTYASLFSAIGTTFGAGDGSTTFGIPDLRGEFLRGWDDARGIDSGRSFGSAQSQAIQSHRHLLGLARNDRPDYFVAGYASGPGGSADMASVFNGTYNYQGYSQYEGGSETRSRNIALLACIKF